MRHLGIVGLALLAAIVPAGCRKESSGSSGQNAAAPSSRPCSLPASCPAPQPILAGVEPFGFEPDLVLLITGGTGGRLEVCNCAGPMAGGLARRSGLVRSYRAAFDRVFLLDSGDCFHVDAADLRNEYLLKGYQQIGYDAVTLGDAEWAAGPQTLGRILRDGACYLSTTVRPAGGELPAVTRVARRQWPAVKLAVLSYADDEAFRFVDASARQTLRIGELREAVYAADDLRQAGWTVVLVAHAPEAGLEQAVARVGADLVVAGHTARSESQLLKLSGKPVVKVGGGEYVGVLALKLKGARVDRLEYRLEVVDERWPLDRPLLDTYQAYARQAMRQALDADRAQGLEYVASADCGRCHDAQLKAWRDHPHARAYDTLVQAGRTDDPNCLACHTTGFGARGGFFTPRQTPHLGGVNCQDCHRFNVAEHQARGFSAPPPDEAVCTTCHTPVTDPKFSFADKGPKARCPPRGSR